MPQNEYFDPPEQTTASSKSAGPWGNVLAVLGIAALFALIASMLAHEKRKRIFISFAIEDIKYRDFLVKQAESDRSPFTFTDMSLKQPFTNKWKSRCREHIKSCDGMIALLSKKTWRAEGARWEMWCANDEGVPVLGVHIRKNDKGAIPQELNGNRVIEWTWDGIKEFLDEIPES